MCTVTWRDRGKQLRDVSEGRHTLNTTRSHKDLTYSITVNKVFDVNMKPRYASLWIRIGLQLMHVMKFPRVCDKICRPQASKACSLHETDNTKNTPWHCGLLQPYFKPWVSHQRGKFCMLQKEKIYVFRRAALTRLPRLSPEQKKALWNRWFKFKMAKWRVNTSRLCHNYHCMHARNERNRKETYTAMKSKIFQHWSGEYVILGTTGFIFKTKHDLRKS